VDDQVSNNILNMLLDTGSPMVAALPDIILFNEIIRLELEFTQACGIRRSVID